MFYVPICPYVRTAQNASPDISSSPLSFPFCPEGGRGEGVEAQVRKPRVGVGVTVDNNYFSPIRKSIMHAVPTKVALLAEQYSTIQ